MKRILLILSFFTFCLGATNAQTGDENNDGMQKIAGRLNELMRTKLQLTNAEAEKFSPIFLRYFKELRQTHQQYRTDRPMLQLKVAELRVAYRDKFKEVLDERRANRVFAIEKEFQERVKQEIKERREERRQNNMPKKNTRTVLD
jgi:thiamine kinase-like enzyme